MFEVKLKAGETKPKTHHPSGEEGDHGISISPNSSWVVALAQDDLTHRSAERGFLLLLQGLQEVSPGDRENIFPQLSTTYCFLHFLEWLWGW